MYNTQYIVQYLVPYLVLFPCVVDEVVVHKAQYRSEAQTNTLYSLHDEKLKTISSLYYENFKCNNSKLKFRSLIFSADNRLFFLLRDC